MRLCGHCGRYPVVRGQLCAWCDWLACGAVSALALGLCAGVWGIGRSIALIVVELAR